MRCPRGARRGPPAERGLGRPWRASTGLVPGALRGGVLGRAGVLLGSLAWCCWACGVVLFDPGAVARLAAFAPVCAGLLGVSAPGRGCVSAPVCGAFSVHRVFSEPRDFRTNLMKMSGNLDVISVHF